MDSPHFMPGQMTSKTKHNLILLLRQMYSPQQRGRAAGATQTQLGLADFTIAAKQLVSNG